MNFEERNSFGEHAEKMLVEFITNIKNGTEAILVGYQHTPKGKVMPAYENFLEDQLEVEKFMHNTSKILGRDAVKMFQKYLNESPCKGFPNPKDTCMI